MVKNPLCFFLSLTRLLRYSEINIYLLVEGSDLDKFAIKRNIKLLSVVIPVYNESRTLEKCIKELYLVLDNIQTQYEVFIVESNSTDGSREILIKLNDIYNFKLILQDTPKGKGFAVRSALNLIMGDVFAIYDADDEYNPNDFMKLLAPIESGDTSFVLGSRHSNKWALRKFEAQGARALLMNVAHIVFTQIINVLFRSKFRDPFTMYKIIRKEIFDGINLTSNRFDLDWELVCVAIRLGSAPLEIPVQYSSRSFAEGKKIRLFYDPLTWIVAIFKFRIMPINRSRGK